MERYAAVSLLFVLVGCMEPIKREYQPHDGLPVLSQKDSVRQTIREHVKEVHACFEASTTGTADLNGRVTLEWRLDKEGNVRDAHMRQGLDPKVDKCLLSALENWSFAPPPAGGPNTTLTHTFVNGQSENK